MTTAYVLVGQTDFEGDTILGVYRSFEEADAAYEEYPRPFDYYEVYQIEVGAAAEFRC